MHPTGKWEIACLVSEIHSVIYPGSNADNLYPGTHWLGISDSQFSRCCCYITSPYKVCYQHVVSRYVLYFSMEIGGQCFQKLAYCSVLCYALSTLHISLVLCLSHFYPSQYASTSTSVCSAAFVVKNFCNCKQKFLETSSAKTQSTTVVATTGWLETYAVPHAAARNTILNLKKQVQWWHDTPERIESDKGIHFKNSLVNIWAKDHIPYHAPASGEIE